MATRIKFLIACFIVLLPFSMSYGKTCSIKIINLSNLSLSFSVIDKMNPTLNQSKDMAGNGTQQLTINAPCSMLGNGNFQMKATILANEAESINCQLNSVLEDQPETTIQVVIGEIEGSTSQSCTLYSND